MRPTSRSPSRNAPAVVMSVIWRISKRVHVPSTTLARRLAPLTFGLPFAAALWRGFQLARRETVDGDGRPSEPQAAYLPAFPGGGMGGAVPLLAAPGRDGHAAAGGEGLPGRGV